MIITSLYKSQSRLVDSKQHISIPVHSHPIHISSPLFDSGLFLFSSHVCDTFLNTTIRILSIPYQTTSCLLCASLFLFMSVLDLSTSFLMQCYSPAGSSVPSQLSTFLFSTIAKRFSAAHILFTSYPGLRQSFHINTSPSLSMRKNIGE